MTTPPAYMCVTKESPEQALMAIPREVSSSGALTWAPKRMQAPLSGMTQGVRMRKKCRPGNTL